MNNFISCHHKWQKATQGTEQIEVCLFCSSIKPPNWPPVIEKTAPTTKKKQKEIIPTEYDEGCVLASFLEDLLLQGKIIFYTKTAQETWTKYWGVIKKNKLSGVKKGIPDYVVLLKKKVLWIELKRIKRSVVSPEQELFLKTINKIDGNLGKVCYGAKQAIDYLKLFL